MDGDILVVNAGSSSLKVAVFAADGPDLRVSGQVEGIGTPHARATAGVPACGSPADGQRLFDQSWPGGDGPADHGAALALVVEKLAAAQPGWAPAAIGHRVVHGGTRFRGPVVLDAAARADLEALVPLDPLHLPANLRGIAAAAAAFPGAAQVACFDTAFHQAHPWYASTYALPREFYDAGVRRYGFHGLSYESIVASLRRLAPDLALGSVVVAHLGNGASLCAIDDGHSVECTMGFSVLDGVPMGTRCGQLDPGVLLYLMRERGLTAAAIEDLLYKQSGLLGLSGVSADMRDLLASDRPEAKQAVECFVYRVTMAFGALAAALGGVDGLVFTGGIGEHAVEIRARILRNLAWLGIEVDEAANAAGGPRVSTAASKVEAWVVPTEEERMIAHHVIATIKR